MESSAKHTMLAGPWGGEDGFYWDDGVYSAIRQLEIAHGVGIDSIKIEYDMKGKSVWSEKHGGLGGSKFDKVRLEYPDEYLTLMHGHYGSLQERGPTIVRSLTFETNKRKYGPFGVQEGTQFTSKMQGKIVGFVGKCGWYLDSVGAYIEPLHKPVISNLDHFHNKPIASNPTYHSQHYVAQGTEKYEYSMIQGSLGKNYDLIVAVRQKDDSTINSPHKFNRSGRIYDHAEPKNEVGASVAPSTTERAPSRNVVKCGPWGGHGGTRFDDGVHDGIRQINVSRNVAIVSIRVCYDRNGEPVWGPKNGGTGSIKHDKIPFDYPSERLTHMTGYHGPTMIMGPNVIKSLTFHTTKGKYGPFGEEDGEFFSTKSKDTGSVVLGFHGRKGLFVDAIGVHKLEGNDVPSPSVAVVSSTSNAKLPATISVSKPNGQTTSPASRVDHNSEWNSKTAKRGQVEEANQRLVKNPAPYGTGPWGGDCGKPWDDGVFTGIKQIILTKTDAICCIEFEYDRNGQSVWSVKHGGNGGQTADRVKLDYPNEVLTCISGYYGPNKKDQLGTKVLQSLTFHTSRRKYGPFGDEIGTYFSSGTTEGKVVGFHGRSSVCLDALGVHMQHWLGNNQKASSKHASIMKYFS